MNPEEPTLRDRVADLSHDMEMEALVENAVQDVYRRVWGDNKLCVAERRLAWLSVVAKLLQSSVIDAQTAMLRARLGEKQ